MSPPSRTPRWQVALFAGSLWAGSVGCGVRTTRLGAQEDCADESCDEPADAGSGPTGSARWTEVTALSLVPARVDSVQAVLPWGDDYLLAWCDGRDDSRRTWITRVQPDGGLPTPVGTPLGHRYAFPACGPVALDKEGLTVLHTGYDPSGSSVLSTNYPLDGGLPVALDLKLGVTVFGGFDLASLGQGAMAGWIDGPGRVWATGLASGQAGAITALGSTSGATGLRTTCARHQCLLTWLGTGRGSREVFAAAVNEDGGVLRSSSALTVLAGIHPAWSVSAGPGGFLVAYTEGLQQLSTLQPVYLTGHFDGGAFQVPADASQLGILPDADGGFRIVYPDDAGSYRLVQALPGLPEVGRVSGLNAVRPVAVQGEQALFVAQSGYGGFLTGQRLAGTELLDAAGFNLVYSAPAQTHPVLSGLGARQFLAGWVEEGTRVRAVRLSAGGDLLGPPLEVESGAPNASILELAVARSEAGVTLAWLESRGINGYHVKTRSVARDGSLGPTHQQVWRNADGVFERPRLLVAGQEIYVSTPGSVTAVAGADLPDASFPVPFFAKVAGSLGGQPVVLGDNTLQPLRPGAVSTFHFDAGTSTSLALLEQPPGGTVAWRDASGHLLTVAVGPDARAAGEVRDHGPFPPTSVVGAPLVTGRTPEGPALGARLADGGFHWWVLQQDGGGVWSYRLDAAPREATLTFEEQGAVMALVSDYDDRPQVRQVRVQARSFGGGQALPPAFPPEDSRSPHLSLGCAGSGQLDLNAGAWLGLALAGWRRRAARPKRP